MDSLGSEADGQEIVKKKLLSLKPKFGLHPDVDLKEFNFQHDMMGLPFLINLVEVSLTHEQKASLIDIIYNN